MDLQNMDLKGGSLQISTEVIGKIARCAALEVDGVSEVSCGKQNKKLSNLLEASSIQTPVATYEMLNGQIGYLKIANFDSRCAEETNAAMDELIAQGAQALIFDVRYNGGGYKDELVKVLDKILPEGILFQSEDYKGTKQTDRSDAACIKLPMAVLVNQDSYSAAEFFAAAIQEYNWGKR